MGRTLSFLVSPTTALHQPIRITASHSLVHLLKAASSNWGEGWHPLLSVLVFLSVSLHLFFCLSSSPNPRYFHSNCWDQLKIWEPNYRLNCFCLVRKTKLNQNISVARSRWPVQSYLELIYSKDYSKPVRISYDSHIPLHSRQHNIKGNLWPFDRAQLKNSSDVMKYCYHPTSPRMIHLKDLNGLDWTCLI